MSKLSVRSKSRGPRLRLESLEDRTNPSAGALDLPFGADGMVTTPIGPGGDFASSMAIQADGKIVAAGYSWNGSDYDFALVRYNADGSLDTNFDGDGKLATDFGSSNDAAISVAIQADGKIVAGGYSQNAITSDFALARYNADGSLDTSFDSDGMLTTNFGSSNDAAISVAIQADGKIVAAGHSYIGGNGYFALTRYNPDGSLDTSFDGDGMLTTDFGSSDDVAYSVAIQADGKIVVAGSSNIGGNDLAIRLDCHALSASIRGADGDG